MVWKLVAARELHPALQFFKLALSYVSYATMDMDDLGWMIDDLESGSPAWIRTKNSGLNRAV